MEHRKHPLAECETCPLYKRGKYVPSEGISDKSVLVIGEAPGQKESSEGRPFVGPSGNVLDNVLAHQAGLDRQDVAFTNVVSCRPSGNADPPKDAIAACRPRLEAEVAEVYPDYILALGNTAASATLGRKTKITQDRVGPPKDSIYPDIKVIPTIHPAACLRAHDHFPNFVTDVGKLKASATGEWSPPSWKAYDEPKKAAKILDTLLVGSWYPLIVDIECGKEKDDDMSHPKALLSVGIGFDKDRVVVIGYEALRSKQVLDRLHKLLKKKEIVCHNGKYDLQVLLNMFDWEIPLHADTMLESYCLDERSGTHGLKYKGQELLGAPNWDKQFHEEHGKWDEIYRKVVEGDEHCKNALYKYNAYDCAVTWDIHELHQFLLDEQDQVNLHEMLCDYSNMLKHVESEGILVDQDELANLDKTFQEEIDDYVETIREHIGDVTHILGYKGKRDPKPIPFNPNSPKQVKEILSEKYKVKTASTDENHLIEIAERSKNRPLLVEFIEHLLNYRHVQKRHGTYVKGVKKRLDNDGRIHATFKIHGTTTGRLSCAEPNIQNVPRGTQLRAIYVPAPGNVFIQADYSNAEGRIVVVLSRDETMAGHMNAGDDVHGIMAEQFFGPNWDKEQRVKAKTFVHGTNYGRTPHGIAGDPAFNSTVEEAEVFQQIYFEFCPGIKQWHIDVRNKVLHEQDDLVSVFDRRRRFMLITPDNQEDIVKEALAWEPQSTASDICVTAAGDLHNLGYKVRNIVHDSILVECKESEAEDTAKVMQEVMSNSAKTRFTDKMDFHVPFPIDYAIGYNWGAV